MLDLRTILFIYLIFNLKLNYVNNLIHYYLVQVRGSIGLFFRILFSVRMLFRIEWLFLSLKLGIFPFHFWYFRLLAKLEWENIFLLIRPRKIIVLVIMFSFLNKYLFFVLFLNLGFVVYCSLFEKHLKILLGFSSLFNLVWVLSRRGWNYYWFLYFVGYSLNLFLIIYVLRALGKTVVRDINQFFELVCVFFLGMNTFLIVGLPPFLGFSVKLLILREIVILGSYFLFLVIFTALFIYIYITFFFISICRYLEIRGSFNFYSVKRHFSLVILINFFFRLLFLVLYYLNNRE